MYCTFTQLNTQAAEPHLTKSHGRIVDVVSLSGVLAGGAATTSSYAAVAKHAQVRSFCSAAHRLSMRCVDEMWIAISHVQLIEAFGRVHTLRGLRRIVVVLVIRGCSFSKAEKLCSTARKI